MSRRSIINMQSTATERRGYSMCSKASVRIVRELAGGAPALQCQRKGASVALLTKASSTATLD